MRVLVISTMYPNEIDPTYGIYVKETVEGLKKYNDVDSIVITPVTHSRGLIAAQGKYLIVMIKTIYSTFRRKFDLVHAHYIFPSGLFALIPKYLRRKKLIITAHGSDINILPGKNRVLWYLTRFVLRRADRIIAVSRPLYDKITDEFSIAREKVEVITCGIDPELFRPMDREFCRKMLGLPKDKRIIFHFSSLDPVKRVPLLIESYNILRKKTKDILLVIGGYGREQEHLINLVRKLGVENDVLFTGHIPKKDVPFWMDAADCFILTSESEGTPVTVMEAMATGVRIVATRVGGIPDVVGEFGIIVDSNEPEKIAEAISNAIDVNTKGGWKSRILRAGKFNSNVISEEIYAQYNKII